MLIKNKNLFYKLKNLLPYINKKRKRQVLILLILMICSSFFELFSIGAIIPFLGILTTPDIVFNHEYAKPLIELIDIRDAKELILPVTIIFITSIIFSAIFRFFLLYFQTKVSFAIGGDISSSIYRKILYQKYSIHINRNSSSIISIIANKIPYVIFQIIIPFLTLISSFLILLIIFLSFALYNPKILFFLVTSISIFYLLVIKFTKNRLRAYSSEVSLHTNKVVKLLQEGLGGIRDILIDGSQDVFYKMFEKSDYSLKYGQTKISIISGGPRFIIEAIGISIIAMLAFYITTTQVDGLTSAIPFLGAIALGAQRTLPLLQQIYLNWASIKGGEASLVDILELLEQEAISDNKIMNLESIFFKNSIELKNLSFCYDSRNILALNNINLKIKKGSRLGIIGSTGGGKSTLLDILMGLQFPTEGKLEIDGVTITENNYRSWQNKIAHVPQNIFLSDNSILENIAFGIPVDKICIKRLHDAAKKAKISDMIELLEHRYNTIIGENGMFLSGGQRQRIGIARAIYKGAELIIFDEATSALDSEVENEVMSEIESLSKDITLIIVAHRVTTLKNCDKIVEISNGKLIREGSYKEMTFIKDLN